MGDPAQGNPALLGAMVNATPIDVGQPGDSPLPGGHAFYTQYKARPRLTYVGADDGLLHAFWSLDQLVGNVTQKGGSEAFAFLPPEMLPVVTKLYAQGGQLPDPAKHVYGLASSAKVKNLCVSNCANQDTAIWKTELVMTDGFGGTETFALDITDPTSNPPFQILWTTATSGGKATYDAALGLTISVPAFYLNKTTGLDDYRLLFGSGYRVDTSSGGQGPGAVAVVGHGGHGRGADACGGQSSRRFLRAGVHDADRRGNRQGLRPQRRHRRRRTSKNCWRRTPATLGETCGGSTAEPPLRC